MAEENPNRVRHYEHQNESRAFAYQAQKEYGKWLISSLLLAHGAGIGFVASHERLSEFLIPWTFGYLVIGICLAFLSGFLTWINFTLLASVYDEVNPNMIVSDESWPKFNGPESPWIKKTFWGAITTGIISALLIPTAAISAAISLTCQV